ncbi:MAG: response regulator [Desulfobacteraceae bacterium]|nr:response regulator [Desulfobacteraceae bacterium]
MEEESGFDRLKILIAEDDKAVLVLYDNGLSNEVFEKKFVNDGSYVISIFKEWKPDLLLLDIMLPEVSGYAILKEIREGLHDTRTPIIMATSLSDKAAVLDCLQLGIQGYLVKPFSHRDIAGKVMAYYNKANPEKAAAIISQLKNLPVSEADPAE